MNFRKLFLEQYTIEICKKIDFSKVRHWCSASTSDTPLIALWLIFLSKIRAENAISEARWQTTKS